MSFLITSPMINEVAILLLGSLFGLKFTLLYLAAGLASGIIGGFFIDLIGAERYLMPIGNKAAQLAARSAGVPAGAMTGVQGGMPGNGGAAVYGGTWCGGTQCIPGKGEGEGEASDREKRPGLKERGRFAHGEVRAIMGRVWMWVLIGVAVGSFLHGFIPEGFIESRLGNGGWWSVPAAVLLGIPLYSGPAESSR